MYRARDSLAPAKIVKFPRVWRADFFADFRLNRSFDPAIYHCVIQRDGSAAVLGWMQYRSLDEAVHAAIAELEALANTPAQNAA